MTSPPPLPPLAVRKREHVCPSCGASFGVPASWAALLAAVQAHLRETNAHGAGWEEP
jgi:hypothetical protein